ncbi:hypothetical protein MPSEU_000727300 [Mayamaea pseudoterrestris]|nr:hypothetical protein MPSEU_000727300 [Mayamaea pseudoterrestris]
MNQYPSPSTTKPPLPLVTVIHGTLGCLLELEDDMLTIDDCGASVGSFLHETSEDEPHPPHHQAAARGPAPIRHVRTYSAETSFPSLFPGAPLNIQVQQDAASVGGRSAGVAITVRTPTRDNVPMQPDHSHHLVALMAAMNEAIFSSHYTTISDTVSSSSSSTDGILSKSASSNDLMGEASTMLSARVMQHPPAPLAAIAHKEDGLLHNVCFGCKPAGEEAAIRMLQQVQEILQKDPQSLMRKYIVHSTKMVYHAQTQGKVERQVKAPYQYPLHMALANKSVPACVIQALLEAGMKLAKAGWTNPLMLLDGHQLETPLMVLLKHQPHQVKLMDELLLSAPTSVALLDRRGSTALHLAVRHGASLAAIRHLMIVEPKCCQVENRLRQTPLILAQRSSTIDMGVLNFLGAQTHCGENDGRLI